MKKIEPVDIIIPTYNNPVMLSQCVSSIVSLHLSYPVRVLIVNNGHPGSLAKIGNHPLVHVIQTGGKNLGWEGGLKKGLEHSKSEFVCFMNDDAYVPTSSRTWLQQIMSLFRIPGVGAVGPTSNVVMGAQNIWRAVQYTTIEVSFLVGFCMVVRRRALEEVGGIDDTLPGGDDLDLSIRLRSAGWKLVCRRDVFVFHHGFVTGTALHGGANKAGGWNSREMTERTDTVLIQKHGFRKWFECRMGLEYKAREKGPDHEGSIVRQYVQGDKVADLGCANNKTVPHAIGVDIVPRGEKVAHLNAVSEADITADVERDAPFEDGSMDCVVARHILEHTMDPLDVLRRWARMVKPGGKLIVVVPDEDVMPSVSLNPEHLHAYTAQSIKNLVEAAGLTVDVCDKSHECSLVVVATKPTGVAEFQREVV